MADPNLPSALVDVQWLHDNFDHPRLLILDASWHMPAAGRDAQSEWRKERIVNSRFFDFDKKLCDQNSQLPHMLPSAELFSREAQTLGINADNLIVVYDSVGIFSSPRAWWMLNAMGHQNVAVLDGGLMAWKQAELDIDCKEPLTEYAKGDFTATYQAQWVTDAQAALQAIENKQQVIIDARPAARFAGVAPEPRPGLRSGHMPGANNLPFDEILRAGRMKPLEELQALYATLLEPQSAAIFSCGSGVTASVLAFGAHLAGYSKLSVYDGSWSEWGAGAHFPVVSD